ncbi:hypothetical protein ACKKBG_A03630 [Auxenochlorella protothecoides x Auxenochlorella symbiontica]
MPQREDKMVSDGGWRYGTPQWNADSRAFSGHKLIGTACNTQVSEVSCTQFAAAQLYLHPPRWCYRCTPVQDQGL